MRKEVVGFSIIKNENGKKKSRKSLKNGSYLHLQISLPFSVAERDKSRKKKKKRKKKRLVVSGNETENESGAAWSKRRDGKNRK
jgi:hypothetical protein